MLRVSIRIFCIAVICSLYACTAEKSSVSGNQPDTDVAEQLAQIRAELKTIRSEMAQQRQALTEVHKATVASPVAAAKLQPTTFEVEPGDGPVLGNKNATIWIVEFTDFQCPFCSRYHTQVFPQLKQNYIETNKIQYTVRDYPLGFHKYAKLAAISTNCAADQNAYWKMRDELFASKGVINETLFTELAEKLGLEMNDFSKCIAEDIRAKKVESDLAYGQRLGIQGTPSFFVGRMENGKLVNAQRIIGAQPYSKFAQVVDKLIKKPLM